MINLLRKIAIGLSSAVLVASLLTLNFAVPSYAKTCDYQLMNDNNYGEWLDPCDTVCGENTGASANLVGDNNLEKIWNWLIGKGLSPEQTAGVMGNMRSESGLNPFRFQNGATNEGIWQYDGNIRGYNGHAWGLVQWDGPRRIDASGTGGVLGKLRSEKPEYAEYVNLTYGNSAEAYTNAPPEVNDFFISFELEYMYAEATPGGNRSTVWDDLKATTTVLDATVLFHNDFEGSADSVEQVRQGRGAAAQAIFDEMGGQSASAAADCDQKPTGEVVYYSQHDPRWASIEYAGGGTIDEDGCGPTSMAIILASLVDPSITPPMVAENAGAQSGRFTTHGPLIDGVRSKWGVGITDRLSMDEAIEFVKSGKGYVWMGGTGAAPFTSGGHMVAMVGVTESGEITIADPHNPPHEQISNWSRDHIEAGSGSRYGVSAP